ncbi:MAG: calcium-binding protein, partial [Cyanobacteriota bacterium]
DQPVAVDLGQAGDQTITDTISVLGFNNVFGSPDLDTLIGNQNPNQLFGNDGDDLLVGIGGDNTLVGGGGTNTLRGGNGNDLIIAGPQDIVSGGNGIDTLIIESDENLFVTIAGGVEVLITGNGDNFIEGSPETDTLISTGGDNTLFGNGGGDFFLGGPGGDLIVGGSGADSLVFNNPGDGVDRLNSSFESQDVILVSAAGFGGGLTPGVLPSEQFTSGGSASTPEHRFIFEPITTINGVLYYDPDGNGPQPQVSILNLNDVITPNINASSIIVF